MPEDSITEHNTKEGATIVIDSVDSHEGCNHDHQKKKVKGLSMRKLPSSSSLNTLGCDHSINYAKLSGNLSHEGDTTDPNTSTTIEGLLVKKPIGVHGTDMSEEECEEDLRNEAIYEKLLDNNKEWVIDKLSSDPEFFSRWKDIQTPDYLLIGCSDSRVPPDQLTKTQPGQIFIHRNVANLVVNTDFNVMSVLQYAVEVLKVKHVIVMGHTRCGGVMSALSGKYLGLIDNWLRNIKDVYRLHKNEVDSIEDKSKRLTRMIELNIIEQTLNVCKTSIVQSAWRKGQSLHIHGWLYDIESGLIKDLEIEETRWKDIENIYKLDFDA